MTDFSIDRKTFISKSKGKIIVEVVRAKDKLVQDSEFRQFMILYNSSTLHNESEIAYFDITCDNREQILEENFWEKTNLENLYTRKYIQLNERIIKANSNSDDEPILELDYPKRIKGDLEL